MNSQLLQFAKSMRHAATDAEICCGNYFVQTLYGAQI